jgi:hypothetical protein
VTEQAYVRAVRTLYLQLPNAHPGFSRSDRCLAESLFQRNIPFNVVRSALVLATARRICRDPAAPSLSPVRSLHYFIPAIDEILRQPLPSGYVRYLESKIAQYK